MLQHRRFFVVSSLLFGLTFLSIACQQPQPEQPQLSPPQASSPDASISPLAASATPTPSPLPTAAASPSPTPVAIAPLQGTYRGGGFTVTVSGEGQNASYRGCDSENRCLDIPNVFSIQGEIYTWVNGDYRYTLSPAESSGQYRLQVFDPSRTAIVNTLVSPVATGATSAPADPNFARELVENTECSFVVADSGSVNIRKGPGTQYDVIAQLKRGDDVRALYREGDWVRLAAKTEGLPPNETFEPLEGWISNRYLNGCSEDKFEMWRD